MYIAVVLSTKKEKSAPSRDFSCFNLQHSVILFTELEYWQTNPQTILNFLIEFLLSHHHGTWMILGQQSGPMFHLSLWCLMSHTLAHASWHTSVSSGCTRPNPAAALMVRGKSRYLFRPHRLKVYHLHLTLCLSPVLLFGRI